MACAVRTRLFLGRWASLSVGLCAVTRQRTLGREVFRATYDNARGRTFFLSGRQYSNKAAGVNLLSCVEEELELEQKVREELPEVTGFNVTVSGCTAKLHRQYNSQEKVMVELDTHHAIEVIPDEQEEEEDEGEPFFVPAFTVTITNDTGSQLQVDCSFDEHGQYMQQGSEWDNLNIDSVSVVPAQPQDSDTMYTVTADNLSSELYDGLQGYLQERGIDQRFAREVIALYRVHEHQCYLEHSLKALRNFLQT